MANMEEEKWSLEQWEERYEGGQSEEGQGPDINAVGKGKSKGKGKGYGGYKGEKVTREEKAMRKEKAKTIVVQMNLPKRNDRAERMIPAAIRLKAYIDPHPENLLLAKSTKKGIRSKISRYWWKNSGKTYQST